MSSSDTCLTAQPVARTEMLIRKPAAKVFAAFAAPEITSQFWFSRGSGTLQPSATVTWHWEMYGFSTPATVTAFEPERLNLAPDRFPDGLGGNNDAITQALAAGRCG